MAGAGGSTPVRETYTLSDDGALTIEIAGEQRGHLRYVRLLSVGACET